jgi:hypothetical protein
VVFMPERHADHDYTDDRHRGGDPDWQQAGFRVNAILWSFGVNTGGEILERVAGESTEDEANGRSEAKVA